MKRGLFAASSGIFETELKESELTFWVDPLDGSSGLAAGHTEHVTCIIGVAYHNRPILGVIHKPFAGEAQSNGSGLFRATTLEGRTYIGLP